MVSKRKVPRKARGNAARPQPSIATELRRIAVALETIATSRTPAPAAAPVAAPPATTPPSLSPGDEHVFQRLRSWRSEQARRDEVPPYIVASDATLRAVATKRPATPQELREVRGIGPAKAERYGNAILSVVAA